MAGQVLRLIVICVLAYGFSFAQRQPCPPTGEEMMSVGGNAPIVTLHFKRPDGKDRSARFLFDSGGGAVIVDSGLANDLGLKPIGAEMEDGGVRYAPVSVPKARLGRLEISLITSKAFVHLGPGTFNTRESVEGLLPGKALEPYQVVLDYPKQRFMAGISGCIAHQGVKMDTPFLPASGHPVTSVLINNQRYNMLLDTGAKASLARKDLIEALTAAHPDWPASQGASGSANMPEASGRELLLRVPEMEWGGFHLHAVLLVSRSDETYSQTRFETPEPIVGALGGNVLAGFRVEIDYPHGSTYLLQASQPEANDMNSAGLVLDVDAASDLVVVAISSTADAATKKNVLPGDIILAIDGRSGSPWTINDASQALSGAVGSIRSLLIRRQGKEVPISVVVSHLL